MKIGSDGLIDFGGGATPRHKDDPHIILSTTGAPKILSSDKFKMLIKKTDETGRLDLEDFNSAKEMGQFLDFYNDTVVKKRQTAFEKHISDINEYYWKLWARLY